MAVLLRRGLPGAAIAAGAGLVTAFAAVAPAGAARAHGPTVEVVVQTVSSDVAAAAVGLTASHPVAAPGHRYILRIPASEVPAALAQLRSEPGVSYASVVHAVHADVTPNDPCYVWPCTYPSDSGGSLITTTEDNLVAIGAPAAWTVTKGAGQVVAVLDSGADASHPDLVGKIRHDVNVCTDDPACGPASDLSDGLGHGTHVTGILAAETDNDIGVASLGWDVKVDEYKVLDSQGVGNTADVATAIYEAVGAGDRVINMSFSNYACPVDPSQCGPDPDEEAAVEYALAHNVVVVAAAGNDGVDSPTYPASYPGVLAVAATDDRGVVQPYSEWGRAANIAAPGLNIVSTWNDGSYRVASGTSMAAPQVSAAAALLIAHDPSLSGPQVTGLLESSAREISGGNPIYGGTLDVPVALAAASHPPRSYNGYHMVGSDGRVYTYGSEVALGGMGGRTLAKPIVGIAEHPDGLGYWLDASDGGVFSFGDAGFYGSTGGIPLNQPVVGMAATPSGRGYWLVARDGGVFSFGDAAYAGSAGAAGLPAPVVGMSRTPDGRGYWLATAAAGILPFGDARAWGSASGQTLPAPAVGVAS